jgi:predicted DNA-binding protein (MmcQ/YjbR family)
VKWGQDLCFCVGGKMFAAVNLEPPHQLAFKCAPERFAELAEREGIIPAPYLARAMWVQESKLGAALELQELGALIRSSYDLVLATVPRSKRSGAAPSVSRTAAPAAGSKHRRRAAKSTGQSGAKVRGRSTRRS